MKTAESKPGFAQRWKDAQPTKSHLVWACVVTAILTMIVGFNWGGWMSSGSAQKMADTMVKDAIVQRLVPICVAQYDQDPEKVAKLGELNKLTSYQQIQFVRDQGWATISGDEKPDTKVADACAKLLIQQAQALE
ncbi:MAG TPA: hypothetical protein PL105_06300 [Caldilineaceae bacterium]|nr:hypothetical protein [Caldilineaceae bacterium]